MASSMAIVLEKNRLNKSFNLLLIIHFVKVFLLQNRIKRFPGQSYAQTVLRLSDPPAPDP
jgi:hypothetical protein